MAKTVFQYFCFPDRSLKNGDILGVGRVISKMGVMNPLTNYAYGCRVIRNVWNETFMQSLYHYLFSNGLKFITFSRGPSVVQNGIISGIWNLLLVLFFQHLLRVVCLGNAVFIYLYFWHFFPQKLKFTFC